MNRFIALLPLLALTACPDPDPKETGSCTDMGCEDGFYVAFEKSTWDAGQYLFEVDVDGNVYTCQVTIPLGTDGTDGCPDTMIMVEQSGSELPVDQQSIPGLWVNSVQAAAVTITVSLNGAELGSQDFVPAYETLEPNGAACGPVCQFDSASMGL